MILLGINKKCGEEKKTPTYGNYNCWNVKQIGKKTLN